MVRHGGVLDGVDVVVGVVVVEVVVVVVVGSLSKPSVSGCFWKDEGFEKV